MTLDEFLSEWRAPGDRLLVHTSGSTGQPKPLWVEKRRMLASARTTCDFLGLKPGDTALLCLSLDYIAGKMMVVRALERQLRLVCVEPSGHPLAWNNRQGGESVFSLAAMVPLQVWNSLQVPEECERLRQIRHLIIGGGPVDPQLAEALADFPNAVWSTYGMTETLSHIALRRLNGPQRSEWYTPFEGVEVSLNAEGCLVVDAPQVCAQPLVTNDLAEVLEPAGAATASPAGTAAAKRFRILGRRDNVVCTGGMKIQMEEVERKLAPHVGVPFLITKCPDPRLGEAVAMLVEGEAEDAGAQSVCAEVLALCRRVLTRYEQPRHVFCVPTLPLTPTGKPARAEAERMATALSTADRAAISRR